MELKGVMRAAFVVIALWASHTRALPSNKRALRITHQINREGPWLALVTVYPPEEAAFISTKLLKPHPKYPWVDFSGRRFRIGTIYGKKVIYVRCGVGMLNAGVTTQMLSDLFNIVGVVHFGIAGNANDSLSIGDVTVPKYVAHTGIWEWLEEPVLMGEAVALFRINKVEKSNGTMEPTNVGHLDVSDYNVPQGKKANLLGRIAFQPEEFYKEIGEPNVPQNLLWAEITSDWFDLANKLKGLKLVSCINSSICLPRPANMVFGLRASTANIFVDNGAYRQFLFKHFQVASVDEESAALVLTCLSNKLPVIVFRGLSDLAGSQQGENAIATFGPLAAMNSVKATLEFIRIFPSSKLGNFT
eukprot:Gb_29069 [translate_table: standard]